MNDKEHAKIEVGKAAGNAGDASGSADQAVYLFGIGDLAGAADRMQLAREQAEKAMVTAAQAEWRLRRVMVLEAEHAAANAVIERLRGALQEAVDGMGGSYAIWSQKAREILTALKTPNRLS